jgi:hypothetical protein
VRERFEHQRVALAPVRIGVDRRTEPAFDGTEDGFHLRSLPVRSSLSLVLNDSRHPAAEVLLRQFFRGWLTRCGEYDCGRRLLDGRLPGKWDAFALPSGRQFRLRLKARFWGRIES